VSPWEWQPLIAGHETTYPPSLSLSMITLSFISFLPILELLMDLTLPEVMNFFQVGRGAKIQSLFRGSETLD
jgi:hypothetical protein